MSACYGCVLVLFCNFGVILCFGVHPKQPKFLVGSDKSQRSIQEYEITEQDSGELVCKVLEGRSFVDDGPVRVSGKFNSALQYTKDGDFVGFSVQIDPP